jgi:hypothetical protein
MCGGDGRTALRLGVRFFPLLWPPIALPAMQPLCACMLVCACVSVLVCACVCALLSTQAAPSATVINYQVVL